MSALDVFLVGPPLLGAAEALTADGLAVESAPTCISALLRLAAKAPRLVVLGGRAAPGREEEAVSAFRDTAPQARILLTVPSSTSRRSPNAEFGADATLPEPFAPPDLVEAARRLLEPPPPVAAVSPASDLIQDLVGLASRVENLSQLVTLIVDLCQRRARARRISLLLYDQRHRELMLRKAVGLPADITVDTRIPLGRGIAGQTAVRREPVVVPDVRLLPWRDYANHGPYESWSCVSVPLLSPGGRLLGVINLADFEGGFTPEPGLLARLLPIFDQAALSLATAIRIQRLRNLSHLDERTNLHNDRYFSTFLEREISLARRHPRVFGIAILDVDHFRLVNEAIGHEGGNRVLRRIANTLRQAFRATDLVARYAGDEFVVFLPDVERTTEGIEGFADRVVSRVREIRFADEPRLPHGRVTVSMGVAFFPADGLTAKEMLHAADRALYNAKRNGRDRASFDTSA